MSFVGIFRTEKVLTMKILIFSPGVLYSIFFIICSLRDFNCSKKKIQLQRLVLYGKKKIIEPLQKSDHSQSTQNLSAGHLYQCMFLNVYSNLCTKLCAH